MDSSPCAKWPLCQGSIDNYSFVSLSTWISKNCISCAVHNYAGLADSIYYCLSRTVSNSEFEFKVFKKRTNHFFQLHCQLMDGMIFYIKYGEGDFSVAIPSKQTEYGYWAEVPKKVVYDPRNKYLHNENTLVVQFHSVNNSSVYNRMPFAANGRRTRRDEELFSRDMLKLFEVRDSTGDLLIEVQGEQFMVHKFVFEARALSSKLKSNLNHSLGWKQINIKGDPLMMDKVVRYMYSGVLEETDLGGTLKVLEIAVSLEMTNLVQTVIASLTMIMSKDNAPEILQVAQRLEVTELAYYAEGWLIDQEIDYELEKALRNLRKKRR